jgi:hypothetical protein
MRSIRFQPLLRLATGALVVLFAQDFCALRPARAGCNHLINSGSDRTFAFNQLDELIQGSSAGLALEELGRGSQPSPGSNRNKPCSGPSCSSRAPLPVSSASSGSDGFDQWGAMSTVAVVPGPSPTAGAFNESGLRASAQRTSIFHPPRA